MFSFRVRFRIGLSVQLDIDAPELDVKRRGPIRVRLKASDAATIKAAHLIALVGSGYSNREAAEAEGRRWLSALQAGFARIHVGADFGLREPREAFTPLGLQWARQHFGVDEVLNDEPGVTTYPTDPAPRFVSTTAQGVVGKPGDKVVVAITQALDSDASVSERDALAYDLFSASFFERSADARFMMLMMAIETLIEVLPRDELARAHVDDLINQTRRAGLPAQVSESLLSSLRWLRDESISGAGRRLAASVGDRSYSGDSPAKLFTHCYKVRSRLVHGALPRPGRDDVDKIAAALELLVGDLISLRASTAVGEPGDP